MADALTFHAFEIESEVDVSQTSVKDEVLDIKVTPNRGHDCLSHRGIAKELSAILNIPLAHDPFEQKPVLEPKTDAVPVSIESELCRRYVAGVIKGAKVGPSPKWLRERLEAIGARSINNIVDATNFVMFNIGQPLHAFDASKVRGGIRVRLDGSRLVIADDSGAIAHAGIKGGDATRISDTTVDIILESANFDGVSVRKTAQALKLRTDASQRFEQDISPELAIYGAQAGAEMILKLAGGELAGFIDIYPKPQEQKRVSVTLEKINKVLGTSLSEGEVLGALRRLGLAFTGKFEVAAPFERLDLEIPEDLIEEVARIVGYDKISAELLPNFSKQPEVNANFYAAEKMREELTSDGYSEVYTSVFADTGKRVVANKVDGTRPYLRNNLIPGLKDALERNRRNKDLLGLKEIKLFEIGTVWKNGNEETVIGTADEKEIKEKPLMPMPAEKYDDLPLSQAARYRPFSKYPYIVRDIAFWTDEKTDAEKIIQEQAGPLMVKISLFDKFEKGGKISLAYRLVFQSFERTLIEQEVNEIIQKISHYLGDKGFEIR